MLGMSQGGASLGGNYNSSSGANKSNSNQGQGTLSQYFIPGAGPAYNNLTGVQSQGYANLAGGLGNQYNTYLQQALQGVNTYGQVQQQQLAQQYQQQAAQQQQSLMDRGLGNSTIGNSVQSGLTQQEALARQNLGQNVGQYQANVLGQFGLPYAQAMGNLGQTSLAAQNAFGQQYLGLVGQQGQNVSSTSGFSNQYNVGNQSGWGLNGGVNAGQQANPYSGLMSSLNNNTAALNNGGGQGFGNGYYNLPGGQNVGSGWNTPSNWLGG